MYLVMVDSLHVMPRSMTLVISDAKTSENIPGRDL
jgi:hypothetical protein